MQEQHASGNVPFLTLESWCVAARELRSATKK